MPVLMIAEQPNLDEGTYASMLEQLMPLPRSANGFMSHAGGLSPAGGTAMIEIWSPRRIFCPVGQFLASPCIRFGLVALRHCRRP